MGIKEIMKESTKSAWRFRFKNYDSVHLTELKGVIDEIIKERTEFY